MIRSILMLGVVASLSACATVSDGTASAVDRAEASYRDAAAFAAIFTPFLSAERQAQIRAAQVKVEIALLVARAAATTADRQRAIEEATRSVAAFRHASGG